MHVPRISTNKGRDDKIHWCISSSQHYRFHQELSSGIVSKESTGFIVPILTLYVTVWY